ncbi:MAG: flagellar biosynthesis protein [Clostridiales bacterium]|nr:flagellar biosynthesis protein [Clostridiales bacterium]
MNNGKIDYNRTIMPGRINGISVPRQPKNQSITSKDIDFKNIFQDALNQGKTVKFSKHAQQRMNQRSISLSHTQIDRINSAVEKAQAKGVRDSLIVMGDLALIVNVPTKTVVTAVDGENLKENIFTNIDGAVIL